MLTNDNTSLPTTIHPYQRQYNLTNDNISLPTTIHPYQQLYNHTNNNTTTINHLVYWMIEHQQHSLPIDWKRLNQPMAFRQILSRIK